MTEKRRRAFVIIMTGIFICLIFLIAAVMCTDWLGFRLTPFANILITVYVIMFMGIIVVIAYRSRTTSWLHTIVTYHEIENVFVYKKQEFLYENYGTGAFDPFDETIKGKYDFIIVDQNDSGTAVCYKLKRKDN